jgi:hypothetical protein
VSMGVGIFFGLWPAVNASRLDPVRGAAVRVFCLDPPCRWARAQPGEGLANSDGARYPVGHVGNAANIVKIVGPGGPINKGEHGHG